jgi:hypothetical protein
MNGHAMPSTGAGHSMLCPYDGNSHCDLHGMLVAARAAPEMLSLAFRTNVFIIEMRGHH